MSDQFANDWRRVSKVTRQVERQGPTYVPSKSRHRRTGGGGDKGFWAKITSEARDNDGDQFYGYEWKELAYDKTKKRMAIKEGGREGTYGDGMAVEQKWNSTHCLKGSHVYLTKEDDFYLFHYPAEIIVAKLVTGGWVGKSTAEYDGTTLITDDKSYGAGASSNVRFYYPDPDDEQPFVWSERKYSKNYQTNIQPINAFPVSIPPYLADGQTSEQDVIMLLGWHDGRWIVLASQCEEV